MVFKAYFKRGYSDKFQDAQEGVENFTDKDNKNPTVNAETRH